MAKKPINVKFDPELLEALRQQAKAENRTLSNLLETLSRDYLRRVREEKR